MVSAHFSFAGVSKKFPDFILALILLRCHARTHKSEDVVKNTYYYIDDDQRTEVEKEKISKGDISSGTCINFVCTKLPFLHYVDFL